ncbi:4-hydroxybenzoate octaprenyltransferase [Ferriphaselus sp. R-1]|uniref:4-hydroxybenzoate octaprenyltransferase n=1 Tax=Ferriphaselus sp. R-1 TaxID=1485544 RepID=UPI000B183DCD|nr:4-hydroxybenzoate octaprenyltransferase [Ferriphaselus sp. R-1]
MKVTEEAGLPGMSEVAETKLRLYIQLCRLDRPIGIFLLLWPTLWALWIASAGRPDWPIVAIFVAGTILMRSAGCAINDFADRHIDKHVERTKDRPITSQRLSPREALWVATGLSVLAFCLVLPLNALTLWLTVPALFLAGSYPFTKRFIALPQAYLGIAFGFGIPMSFAAQLNHVPMVAWLLMLANLLWCIAYDTEYAMVDRDDDVHLGIHSSALYFGRFDVVAVMLCYAGVLLSLLWVGKVLHMGVPYHIGLIGAAGIASYHYALIRSRQREGCFRAFRHNTWFGAAVFAGIYFDYLVAASGN